MFILIVFGLTCPQALFAQHQLVNAAKKQEIEQSAQNLNTVYKSGYQRALSLAQSSGLPVRRKYKASNLVAWQGVNSQSFPYSKHL